MVISQELSPRILISVTRAEENKKLEELFDRQNVHVCYQCRGNGTAPSEIMDIFGLGGTARLLTFGIMPKCRVKELLAIMNDKLLFKQKGKGIAFSIPVIGGQSVVLDMLNDKALQEVEVQIKERAEKDMEEVQKKSEYCMILVSVASGYSDEVIDAARSAGARGGTVMKGRRRNSEALSQYFGVSMQDEQEFVMIVAAKEKKTKIMTAICNACGLRTPAHGIVLAFPVDEAIGLEE